MPSRTNLPLPSGNASGSAFSRRTLLKAAGIGAAAFGASQLLAACSPSGSSASSSGSKATVRMWTWYTEDQQEFPKLIKQFEAKNPNITIENRIFGTTDQYLPALQAAVSGGDVPEIFAPHTRALTYGKAGVSADLSKELDSKVLKDMFESANQEYTYDGKQYAVGWEAQTFGIFYDPEKTQAAGVDPESIETWDDLIASVSKFKAANQTPVAISCSPSTSGLDFFLPLITQEANDPTWYLKLDQLQKGYTYTDPNVVKSLELLQKIVEAGVFQQGTTSTSGDQVNQLFYTGTTAMMFNGSFANSGIITDAPADFSKRYKVIKTPALASGKKHWTANQAGAGLAVSETSKNKAAALEFLRFLYDPDQYATTMNNTNSMPCTKTAAQQIQNPIVKQMAGWLIDGEGCPHIPFGDGSSSAGDPLSKIYDGTGQPEDVAKQMQAAVLNAKG
jgi:ABC-type glycerol-3-phosphate transport system substrate-binding protein